MLLVITIVSTFAIAAIVLYKEVSMTMKIQARYDMKVYDTDHVTVLSSIALGTFYRGDTKRFPSTGNYFIDNIGEADIWLSWQKQGTWPSGVTITMYVDFGANFQPLAEGSICTGRLYAPPSSNNVLKWYFEIEASSSAAFGDFTPKIIWNAHDSATG